jgi:hypothetical protein
MDDYMRHTGYPGGQKTLLLKYCNQKKNPISRKSKRNATKNKSCWTLKFKCCCSEHKQAAQNQEQLP